MYAHRLLACSLHCTTNPTGRLWAFEIEGSFQFLHTGLIFLVVAIMPVVYENTSFTDLIVAILHMWTPLDKDVKEYDPEYERTFLI